MVADVTLHQLFLSPPMPHPSLQLHRADTAGRHDLGATYETDPMAAMSGGRCLSAVALRGYVDIDTFVNDMHCHQFVMYQVVLDTCIGLQLDIRSDSFGRQIAVFGQSSHSSGQWPPTFCNRRDNLVTSPANAKKSMKPSTNNDRIKTLFLSWATIDPSSKSYHSPRERCYPPNQCSWP